MITDPRATGITFVFGLGDDEDIGSIAETEADIAGSDLEE